MSYTRFPLFFDIHEWKILIVGAGNIAKRRVRSLMKFGAELTVIAPSFPEEFPESTGECRILRILRRFENEDIEAECWNMVLACTDNKELNAEIVKLAGEKHILGNDCSDQTQCDFFFPAIVTGDGLVIGISSDGTDHGKVRRAAADIRRQYGDIDNG